MTQNLTLRDIKAKLRAMRDAQNIAPAQPIWQISQEFTDRV